MLRHCAIEFVSTMLVNNYDEKPSGRKEGKPGPKPAIDDTEALILIKEDLENSKFNGEGYLKVEKRLAKTNVYIAKHKVNSLMRRMNF